MSRKILFDACIGSRALNIHKPDSDYDIYQIYTETNPVELFYGNTSWNFSHRIEGNLDTIQSGVKRFMTSLTNGCAQSWEVFVTNKNQINKIDPSFEIFYEIPHTKMVPQLPLVNSVLKKFLIDRSKLTEKPKYNYETIKQGAFVLIALRHGKFLNIIDHVEKYDEIFDAPFLTYLHQIHDGTIKSQDFNHICK